MTGEAIAHELGGRRSGRGWIARCPAHQDRTPSLSITERAGRVLVHCFGGCDQAAVIEALRSRGLWPELGRRELSPMKRHAWGRQRRAAEEQAQRVHDWFIGAALRLADEKLDGELEGDLGRLARAARELFSLQSATVGELIGMYKAAEPGLCGRDEAAGRCWRELCERFAAEVVVKGRGDGYGNAAL